MMIVIKSEGSKDKEKKRRDRRNVPVVWGKITDTLHCIAYLGSELFPYLLEWRELKVEWTN